MGFLPLPYFTNQLHYILQPSLIKIRCLQSFCVSISEGCNHQKDPALEVHMLHVIIFSSQYYFIISNLSACLVIFVMAALLAGTPLSEIK